MTLTQILSKLKSLVYSKTETDTLLGNKAASSHTHSDYIPKSGGAVLTSDVLGRTVNTSRMVYCGGVDNNSGAIISLYGKDSDSLAGVATMQAYNGTSNTYLRIFPTGEARFSNNGTLKNLAMQEDTVPRSGGSVLTGIYLGRNVNNDSLELAGGSSWNNGGSFVAYGKDQPNYGGSCLIHAANGTNETHMWINPNGTATLNSKKLAMYEDVVPRSGGAVMTGTELYRIDDTASLHISGGNSYATGGSIVMRGANGPSPSERGCVILRCNTTESVIKFMYLYPNGTWVWTGTACQITSDQRLKQQITEIDDKLLDAWEDVELSQFKYNDAVDQKGKDKARLHTGYVVQQIDEACKSHNLDISAYGLYCHEEYPEETEEVEVEQEDGTKIKERKVIREASEHYSLRYTETLVVECAFLRREVKRLSERLSKLEQPSTSEK